MKKALITLLIISGIIGIALFLSNGQSVQQKQYTLLSGQTFVDTFKNTPDAVLLDVRTPSEYAEERISGSIHIDFNDPSFPEQIAHLDKTLPYFVYCRSGGRSAQAVAMMQQAGFTRIYELQGGLLANPELVN